MQESTADTRRALSQRIRLALPRASLAGSTDWNFGAKSLSQAQLSELSPFDGLHLKWRLLESDAHGVHNADLWSYSGHASLSKEKIAFGGRYLRHLTSGAFLSFELELIVREAR